MAACEPDPWESRAEQEKDMTMNNAAENLSVKKVRQGTREKWYLIRSAISSQITCSTSLFTRGDIWSHEHNSQHCPSHHTCEWPSTLIRTDVSFTMSRGHCSQCALLQTLFTFRKPTGSYHLLWSHLYRSEPVIIQLPKQDAEIQPCSGEGSASPALGPAADAGPSSRSSGQSRHFCLHDLQSPLVPRCCRNKWPQT